MAVFSLLFSDTFSCPKTNSCSDTRDTHQTNPTLAVPLNTFPSTLIWVSSLFKVGFRRESGRWEKSIFHALNHFTNGKQEDLYLSLSS